VAEFARVLVDQTGSNLFDYAVPEAFAGRIGIGWRVRVPVRNRPAFGTVVELLERPAVEEGIKAVEALVGEAPMFAPELVALGRWMADYYCCPLEVAVRVCVPQVIRGGDVGPKRQQVATVARVVGAEELAALRRRAPVQADAIEWLVAEGKPVPVSRWITACNASRSAVESLARKGWISVCDATVVRDPGARDQVVAVVPPTLNPGQELALEAVGEAVGAWERGDGEPPKPVLLHGVTGSGKTEVYLRAMERVLAAGGSAIMLVPEIALTPQTVERIRSRFEAGGAGVAVLHSHLSAGERHDEWHRIHAGRARIVIGARSAVFAPVRRLGIIVVDEEHETSYKQEDAPRYHARDVAVVRGRMERCAVLLGSATPSIESYRNAAEGKYRLARLPDRVDAGVMPVIRIVDMRQEAQRQKGMALLSDRLIAAMRARLERREQTMLFLNRRGFATSLICPKCGHVCGCPNCSVALTFHRGAGRLMCHLCGHAAVVPRACPECKDPAIRHAGFGTERVEDAVARVFPQAVVRRMDADTMGRKEAYREVLGAFKAGKIDILVGTQMIAKGLHFPNVTLVGIVNADVSLHLPDFRAAERTFQLLTQVAGRAGRGDVEGEVFVQSGTPFHPAIQFARHHDFDGFWEQESEFRRAWDYPPYTHMILVTVRSAHLERGRFTAETVARRISEVLPPGCGLAGPSPAPIERSRGEWRHQMILRGRAALKMSRAVRGVVEALTLPEDVALAVDVDPYHLL
jgi:primosomal protein N' (replication factor Y)